MKCLCWVSEQTGDEEMGLSSLGFCLVIRALSLSLSFREQKKTWAICLEELSPTPVSHSGYIQDAYKPPPTPFFFSTTSQMVLRLNFLRIFIHKLSFKMSRKFWHMVQLYFKNQWICSSSLFFLNIIFDGIEGTIVSPAVLSTLNVMYSCFMLVRSIGN